MLTHRGEYLLQQVDHTLVGVHGVLLVGDRSLIPGGVVRSERIFAELAGTLKLGRPLVQIVADLTRRSFGKAHMRGGMGGVHGNRCQVLDGLVGGDAPLLVDAVQVSQIACETGTHTDQFIGQLVEMLAGHSDLEADRGDQLPIDAGVGILVGDIQHHARHLIGVHGLQEAPLLLRHARHVEHGTAVHHAS